MKNKTVVMASRVPRDWAQAIDEMNDDRAVQGWRARFTRKAIEEKLARETQPKSVQEEKLEGYIRRQSCKS